MPIATYVPKKPCKQGHWLRYISNGHCVECHKAYIQSLPPEQARLRVKKWREQYPQRAKETIARCRAANPESVRRSKEKSRPVNREWQKRNRAWLTSLQMKRQAKKLKATPKWLEKAHFQQISAIYAEAARLTVEIGVPHHVDHEIPLQGETVSGLHVPWNLRVITADENRRKNNRLASL